MASKTELNTNDLPQKESKIDLNADVSVIRQDESVITEQTDFNKQYFDELKFMEEKLTIRIERMNDKNAPKVVDVSVNGRTEFIPVGEPFTIARKYVEVLARSKSDNIETIDASMDYANSANQIRKISAQKYPFSIVSDPNPLGAEWFMSIGR